MSITGLLEQTKKNESKISGVVAGIVINNKDPDKLGRVKVKIPRISGEEESNWARIVTFMGGKERGAFFLPEVDDEVIVAFEYGDINMPYIIGSLWNGKDKPPEQNSNGKNDIRVIKSRSGHIIKLDDTENNEKIEIVDKTGKNKMIIDTKNNKISINSDKDIELSAPNGKVIINARDVEFSSTASTKIKASSDMDLKASGSMKLDGATADLKASGNIKLDGAKLDFKASANVNLNGAIVDIKASGIMNIKGSLLNLN
jgi:uncharacterized protein involved in type VI secretion and phage assembly